MHSDTSEWLTVLLEEGSVTQAAGKLNITQQTLSARLSSLEKEVGARLINRTLPLTLTRQGQLYLEYLEDLKALNGSFARRLDESCHGMGGTLSVGVSVTRGKALIPTALSLFFQENPTTRIELSEGSNEQIIQMLLDKHVDVCIARFADTLPGMSLVPLLEEEMALVIPGKIAKDLTPQQVTAIKRHDLSSLRSCSFLMCVKGEASRKIGQAILDKQTFTPHISLISSSVDLLNECCIKGAGALFCPDFLVPPSIKSSSAKVVKLGQSTRYFVSAGTMDSAESWTAKTNFIQALKEAALICSSK